MSARVSTSSSGSCGSRRRRGGGRWENASRACPPSSRSSPSPVPGSGHVPLPASGLLDPVLAEAQEREVIVLDPLRKAQVSSSSSGRTGGGDSRRSAGCSGEAARASHSSLRPRPGRHRSRTHLLGHRVEHLALGLAIGLDVDDRLDDGVLAVALAADGTQPSRRPSPVRRKRIHGVDGEWFVYPRPLSTMRTESTRNGMSSVTISTMVWVDCQPCCSTWGCRPAPSAYRGPPAGEVQVRRRGAVEIVRRALGEVVGRDARVVLGDEGQTRSRSSPLTRSRASAATSSINSMCCVFG